MSGDLKRILEHAIRESGMDDEYVMTVLAAIMKAIVDRRAASKI